MSADIRPWCWFCKEYLTEFEQNSIGVYFTGAFDAYYHLCCLRDALKKHPEDRETRIVAEELGWTLAEIEDLLEEGVDVG